MISRSLFSSIRLLRNSAPIYSKISITNALKPPSTIGIRSFADEVTSSAKPSKSEKVNEKMFQKTGKEMEESSEKSAPVTAIGSGIGDAKSYFSGAPIKMSRSKVDKDKRSHRVGVTEVTEGVVGERGFEFVDYNAGVYPTLETLNEIFGGMPYRELPEIRIHLSKNNTKVCAVDIKGVEIFRTSASIEGFKNAKKKTEVAGLTVGVSTGNKCMRRGMTHVRVILLGLGPGRQSCIQGMTSTGVNIVSLQDGTVLPELGPRPRKVRRL